MKVRYPTPSDDPVHMAERPQESRPILLFIGGFYEPDAAVTMAGLLELRAEIDRFLFLEAERPKS